MSKKNRRANAAASFKDQLSAAIAENRQPTAEEIAKATEAFSAEVGGISPEMKSTMEKYAAEAIDLAVYLTEEMISAGVSAEAAEVIVAETSRRLESLIHLVAEGTKAKMAYDAAAAATTPTAKPTVAVAPVATPAPAAAAATPAPAVAVAPVATPAATATAVAGAVEAIPLATSWFSQGYGAFSERVKALSSLRAE